MDQNTHDVSGDSEVMLLFFGCSKFSVRVYNTSDGQTFTINWSKIECWCYPYLFVSKVTKITRYMDVRFWWSFFSAFSVCDDWILKSTTAWLLEIICTIYSFIHASTQHNISNKKSFQQCFYFQLKFIHAHMQVHTEKQTHTPTRTKKSHGYIFSLSRTYTHSHTHTSACSVNLYFFFWAFLAPSNISLTFPYTLQPENHTDLKAIMVHLRMLVTFTSTSNWTALRVKAGEWVKTWTLLLLLFHRLDMSLCCQLCCCCCSTDWAWVSVDVNCWTTD